MARKKRKGSSASTSGKAGASAKPLSFSRRQWIIGSLGAVGAVGGASALQAWDTRTKEEHDLTAIGQGTPVVVQVHDRSCPTCRRLKGVMGSVMSDRTDVLYRVADLASQEGGELGRKYNAPKVTLLFFDASGRHQYTHTGLQTAEQLTDLIDNVVGQMENSAS